jgi:DCN1-like protein 1/2
VELLEEYEWDVQSAADAFFAGEWTVDTSAAPPRAQLDERKLQEWFNTYADVDDNETMGVEGIQKFCDDIKVGPEDVLMVVISYHFGAANMLVYTKEEFFNGMQSMGTDSVDALVKRIPELRAELADKESFRAIYHFTFKWACPQGQKSMPVDVAIALWQLLFSKDTFPLLTEWCEYIEKNRKHAISRDEWYLLFDFTATVDAILNGYDENSAWPVVIDCFVEHVENLQKKQ